VETRSLIELVVDYEVPPRLIIEAISAHRLRPIIKGHGGPTIDTIYFVSVDVERVFWAYEYRWKNKEERAYLDRRFRRYDAILAGIIGAVVGTCVTSLSREASRLFDSGARRVSERSTPFRMAEFGMPASLPSNEFSYTVTLTELFISRRANSSADLELVAVADGLQVFWPWFESEVTILHGQEWLSCYRVLEGEGMVQAGLHDTLSKGDSVVRIKGNSATGPAAAFKILKWEEGLWRPTSNGDLSWPIIPRISSRFG